MRQEILDQIVEVSYLDNTCKERLILIIQSYSQSHLVFIIGNACLNYKVNDCFVLLMLFQFFGSTATLDVFFNAFIN